MPVLKYRDPADGQWKTIGGLGADEVFVGPDSPGTGYDLWVDTDDPSSTQLGPWTDLPLLSGFVTYDSGTIPQYRFEPFWNGVRLRGWIKPVSGSIGGGTTAIANVPVNARPARWVVDYAVCHGNSGSTARANTARAEIFTSSGNLSIIVASTYDVMNWVSIDGWTYSLDL
jgi:hypothetical protein